MEPLQNSTRTWKHQHRYFLNDFLKYKKKKGFKTLFLKPALPKLDKDTAKERKLNVDFSVKYWQVKTKIILHDQVGFILDARMILINVTHHTTSLKNHMIILYLKCCLKISDIPS